MRSAADVVVDPKGVGATDLTNLSGGPIDPTVGVLNPSGLVVGFDDSGDLLINNRRDVNDVLAVISSSGSVAANPNSDGRVTVSGGGWNNIGSLIVGDRGAGELVVNDIGGVFSATSTVGNAAGSSGAVTVNGRSTIWRSRLQQTIGGAGQGSLTVNDGATVESGDSVRIGGARTGSGQVFVSGIDAEGGRSRWELNDVLVVGANGTASLSISDGGAVNSQRAFVADRERSSGIVNVSGVHADGISSGWQIAGLLSIGGDGNAALSITDGGSVTSSDSLIGNGSSIDIAATVNVHGIEASGIRSQWQNENLIVGSRSRASLDILDGGKVTTEQFATVGGAAGSATLGTVTVSGTHSTNIPSIWETDVLSIGAGATGRLSIDKGAIVTSRESVVGAAATGDGVVDVANEGSLWSTSGELTVGREGNGRVSVRDGAELTAALATIGSGNAANGSITIRGEGSKFIATSLDVNVGATGSLTVEEGGTAMVGRNLNVDGTLNLAAGSISVNGNVNHGDASSLVIDLMGEPFISSNVGGTFAAAGSLNVRLLDAFRPGSSDTLTVLDAGNIANAFGNVASGERLETLDGAGSFLVSYGVGSAFDANQLVLSDFRFAGGTIDRRLQRRWRA